jgi:isoleucyl-tRNA synthetase
VVNRIQNARKDGGLEVTDKIRVQYRGSEEVQLGISSHLNYIGEEVLANEFELMTDDFTGLIQEEILEPNDFIFTINKNA